MDIENKIKEIQSLRSRGLFGEADKIRSELTSREISIEIERDGSIFWWGGSPRAKRNGRVLLQNPITTPEQQRALSHLLDRTYEFRHPLFLGKITIPGDETYLPKDMLINILLK